MGLTKRVQPYCSLAIITMQMMPKINCPQRVASEATARASAVPDVVAISVPSAFVVGQDERRLWHTIYSESRRLHSSWEPRETTGFERVGGRGKQSSHTGRKKSCHNSGRNAPPLRTTGSKIAAGLAYGAATAANRLRLPRGSLAGGQTCCGSLKPRSA